MPRDVTVRERERERERERVDSGDSGQKRSEAVAGRQPLDFGMGCYVLSYSIPMYLLLPPAYSFPTRVKVKALGATLERE